MRISDDRYSRDLGRLHLAWRFIKLGARTRRIRQWTGLSLYRIRRLCRDYNPPGESAAGLHGTSPRRVVFFWRSAQVRAEAAVLAGFFLAFGALPEGFESSPSELIPCQAIGELLVRAVEQFRALCPQSLITIEYAMLLLGELMRGVELALMQCTRCHTLIVVDRLTVGERLCAVCAHETHSGHAYHARRVQDVPSEPGAVLPAPECQ